MVAGRRSAGPQTLTPSRRTVHPNHLEVAGQAVHDLVAGLPERPPVVGHQSNNADVRPCDWFVTQMLYPATIWEAFRERFPGLIFSNPHRPTDPQDAID